MSLEEIIAEQKITPESAAFIAVHDGGTEVSVHGRDGSCRTVSATPAEVRHLAESFNAALGGEYFLNSSDGQTEMFFNARAVGAISHTMAPVSSGRYVAEFQLDGMHKQLLALDPATLGRLRAVMSEEEKGRVYEGTFDPSLRDQTYAFNVNLSRVRDISTAAGPLGYCLAFRFADAADNPRIGEFRLLFGDYEDFVRRVDSIPADTGFKLAANAGACKTFTPP
jgi:hypothetical protein